MPEKLEGNTWGDSEDANVRRRNPRKNEFVPIEEVPGTEPNPEEALIAKEQRGLNGEDEASEADREEIAALRSDLQRREMFVKDDDPRLTEYYRQQAARGDDFETRKEFTNAGESGNTSSNSTSSSPQGNLGGSSGAQAEYKVSAYNAKRNKSTWGVSHGKRGRHTEYKREKGGDSTTSWRKRWIDWLGGKEAAD